MICFTNKHKIPFQIDEEDLELVSIYSWYIDSGGYVRTTLQNGTLRLHQLLMGKAPEGLLWDHINRDKKDCRKENLRIATRQINTYNRDVYINSTTGIRGIRKYPDWYVVYIGVTEDGERRGIRVGKFKTLDEAITARKEAELKYWS